MVVREEEQALAPDDQQQPRMGALLLDELGTDGALPNVHAGSTDESATGFPQLPSWHLTLTTPVCAEPGSDSADGHIRRRSCFSGADLCLP
jgi:hypothetical protein